MQRGTLQICCGSDRDFAAFVIQLSFLTDQSGRVRRWAAGCRPPSARAGTYSLEPRAWFPLSLGKMTRLDLLSSG